MNKIKVAHYPFLQLAAGGFENHLTKPALEWERFGSLGEINRLTVEIAA